MGETHGPLLGLLDLLLALGGDGLVVSLLLSHELLVGLVTGHPVDVAIAPVLVGRHDDWCVVSR